ASRRDRGAIFCGGGLPFSGGRVIISHRENKGGQARSRGSSHKRQGGARQRTTPRGSSHKRQGGARRLGQRVSPACGETFPWIKNRTRPTPCGCWMPKRSPTRRSSTTPA